MSFGETTSIEIERAATAIVDSCFVVHKRFGPGLLESVYKACLAAELRKRGFTVLREVMVPISASWDLLPLNSFATPDQLTRRLNEFATSRSSYPFLYALQPSAARRSQFGQRTYPFR